MIVCKPKKGTYLALTSILLILMGGLIYTLHHFTAYRTFGLFYYLFSTVLITLVIIMLLVKMMAGYKFISAGQESLIIKLPLRNKTLTYPLQEVLAWEEEKVTANKREFSQITIVFSNKTAFTLSNHEHTNYAEFLKYMVKKLSKKKVVPKK